MRTKMHVAVLMAVVVTAVFATSNLVPALASDHEDKSTIQHVVPDLYDQHADEGDPDYFVVGSAMTECNQIGYDYGFKKDDPTTGFDSGIGDGMLVDYSFDGGNQGTELEWSSNLGIDAVILKASTKANVYAYEDEATEDAGLRTPFRTHKKRGKQYYGISHVTFCWDRELTVSKTADVEFTREYFWDITKSASPEVHDLFDGDSASSTWGILVDQTGSVDRDFSVTGNINVSNPWTETANNVVVTDALANAVVDCGTFAGTLSTGNSVECSYSADIASENDLPSVNVATATADGFQDQSATAAIVKGDPSIEVNDEVSVEDSRNNDLNTSGIAGDVSLSLAETFTCDVDEATHTNTALLIGDDGVIGSASATVEVNCYTPSITKTATDFEYTRAFDWDITKTVDVASHELTVGESAASNYSVAVTKDAGTDSGFVAGGVITVSNPHPTATLVATLSDPGAVLGTTAISVAPNGSQAITWSREDGDSVSGELTNSASFAAFGITYSDVATYSYGEPTELIDDSIVVSDTHSAFGGAQTVSAGTAWNYPVTFNCDEVGSTTYPNTASFNGALDSGVASAYVDVNCAAAPTGEGDGEHETAFMLGNKCFIPDNATRWGWSYQWGQPVDLQLPLSGTVSVVDGSITLPVFAGRGKCDETKGEYVGDVTIDGSTGTFTVVMLAGFHMDEIHIEYDEIGEVAEDGNGVWTVAPGQYDHVDETPDQATTYTFSTGSAIADDTWLIVHLVSGGESS